jgi:hypothetical protein
MQPLLRYFLLYFSFLLPQCKCNHCSAISCYTSHFFPQCRCNYCPATSCSTSPHFSDNACATTAPLLLAKLLTSPTTQVQPLPRHISPYFSLLYYKCNHCPATFCHTSHFFYTINATTAPLHFATFILTSPHAQSRGQSQKHGPYTS